LAYVPKQLVEAAATVKQGQTPSVTVRNFISWFWGSKRRGSFIVSVIRDALNETQLRTAPDFDATYLDGMIELIPASSPTATERKSDMAVPSGQSMVMVESTSDSQKVDPSYRVSRLKSARNSPIAVSPDTQITEAITLMMKYDFSQLPVISGERTIKGVISWKSLGKRLAMGRKCSTVRDAMEPVHVIDLETSLFEAVNLIAKHDCVLVKDEANRVCGIMTSYDVSETFVELGEPFLLLGEIENLIRGMMDGCFSKEDLEKGRDPLDSDRPISKVSDLNFGGYLRIIQDPGSWVKLGTNLDRGTFIRYLERVREIRNDTMHFDPDGIDADDLRELRQFSELLKQLKQISATA
jgi:predicted transcriptional regulator